jgi:hypothetical protein
MAKLRAADAMLGRCSAAPGRRPRGNPWCAPAPYRRPGQASRFVALQSLFVLGLVECYLNEAAAARWGDAMGRMTRRSGGSGCRGLRELIAFITGDHAAAFRGGARRRRVHHQSDGLSARCRRPRGCCPYQYGRLALGQILVLARWAVGSGMLCNYSMEPHCVDCDALSILIPKLRQALRSPACWVDTKEP